MPTSITEETLGAWLIKCDPEEKYDLPGFIAAGHWLVDNWSVSKGSRSKMMTPDHKVILWVSGDGRKLKRGIWGIGWVDGDVRDTVPLLLSEGEESFWHNEDDRLAVTNDIDIYVPLLNASEAVGADDIRAAGINDLEVFRIAAGANPSWVSKDQLARLLPLLPEWPDRPEAQDEIVVTEDDAFFGTDTEANQIIELAAMDAVVDYYDGWGAEDVSLDKVGWDITFTHNATGEVAKVEVKGRSGDQRIVLLTANEVRAAEHEPGWSLVVVNRPLSKPRISEFTAEEALAAAKPYVFKANLDG